MPLPVPVAAIPPDAELRPVAELLETLARIDGWGPRAWREVLGGWQLQTCKLGFEERDGPPCEEGGEVVATLCFHAPHWLGRSPAEQCAAADWLLRRARRELVQRLGLDAWTLDPGEHLRATNACFVQDLNLIFRWSLRLPFAGMCIDGERLARAIGIVGRFVRATGQAQPGLAAHRRALIIQRGLRAALPKYGLVAFLADGSLLARDSTGGVDKSCRPLCAPKRLAVTLDLGRLGRHRGLGIRTGVTAIAGAPYHGKSTLLRAIAGGGEDRPPGDGRERVVATPSLMSVLADDGRPITAQDMTPFFPRLPGGHARSFTTCRASGSTSMAATVLQGVAAGSRLLLVDEDTAAANFLSLQPAMRRILGRDLHGARTFAEVLPDLARQGISTIVVAGASTAAISSAERVLLMRDFLPRDATVIARRACGRRLRAPSIRLPPRWLGGNPDAILGHGHALRIDVRDAQRPALSEFRVDLRGCGAVLDPWLTRGAILGAAWCVRLADGGCPIAELGQRYAARIAEHGPSAIDPFHDGFHAIAPWSLVAMVLERMPGLELHSQEKVTSSLHLAVATP